MTDSDDGEDATDSGDAETLPDLVADLHAHLEATGELPVETAASRWLGEAEAVAADAVSVARSATDDASGDEPRAGSSVPDGVIEERVEQVEMLLSNVEETGSEAADEHVAAARELAKKIEDRLEASR